jgi:hypothetical protein
MAQPIEPSRWRATISKILLNRAIAAAIHKRGMNQRTPSASTGVFQHNLPEGDIDNSTQMRDANSGFADADAPC